MKTKRSFYFPKGIKKVLTQSALHYDDTIVSKTGKPQIIMDYNKNKSGADLFYQMCDSYTTGRKTRRQHYRIFFGMLDYSAVYSITLYTVVKWEKKIKRKGYLFELVYGLIKLCLKSLLQMETLRRPLRVGIEDILVLPNI